MGTLERLQKAILDYLRSINDLNFTNIFAEGLKFKDYTKTNYQGVIINIMMPLPLEASKFTAGPTFGKVAVALEVEIDEEIATNAPSLLTCAEIISRAIHNWAPPLESGYGKIILDSLKPWERVSKKTNDSVIRINFNVQSVLL